MEDAASLRRENERLRQDLRTIARRFTHDVRTPLGSVHANAEVLLEGRRETPDAKFLQGIVESSEDISRLISRLSFVLQASSMTPSAGPIAMGVVVDRVLRGLHPRATAEGVTLVAPAEWPRVRGAAAWLEVVWWNLLDNALRYGGRPPRVDLGWEPVDGSYRCWVRSSAGIPPEQAALLFHPFESLHETGAPRGWGLPIVRRLVELQSGQCGYDVPDGGGSRFFFTLPAL